MASFTTLPGFPDASNTGVKAGVTLKSSGSITVNTPGTVISGLDIKGMLIINAPNVTVENCRITADGWAVVKIKDGVSGTIIRDCEINGTGSNNDGQQGIWGSGTFLRNDIFNVENGITLDGGAPTVIQDNYIHNLKASGSPHYDGIQMDGGISNVVISHNTIFNSWGAAGAIMMDNDFGPISNIKIENNHLAGGSFTIYADGKFSSSDSISGVVISGNYIDEGQYGYILPATRPVWTNNIDASSQPVRQSRAARFWAPRRPTPADPTPTDPTDRSGLRPDPTRRRPSRRRRRPATPARRPATRSRRDTRRGHPERARRQRHLHRQPLGRQGRRELDQGTDTVEARSPTRSPPMSRTSSSRATTASTAPATNSPTRSSATTSTTPSGVAPATTR